MQGEPKRTRSGEEQELHQLERHKEPLPQLLPSETTSKTSQQVNWDPESEMKGKILLVCLRVVPTHWGHVFRAPNELGRVEFVL